MAVMERSSEAAQRTWEESPALSRVMRALLYSGTIVLVIVASYLLLSEGVRRATILHDDLQYGNPRTDHLEAFVGHDEGNGLPTQLIAINLNRQVVIFELPGGDPARVRTITGPYLVGADQHLVPATIALQDIDSDGTVDLLLDIRRERLVFLNRDGQFRLPTGEERLQLQDVRP